MSRDLRVCHLVHHLALGGLENQLLRQVRASDDDVSHAVVYFGTDESRREAFEAAGATVARLAEGENASPARQFRPRRLRRLSRTLSRWDADVLHCHTSLYLHVVGRIAGAAADVPVVGTYHNTAENFHPAIRAAERATRPLSEANVAVSKDVERTFAADARRYEPGDPLTRGTYTVYNGIDVDEFRAEVESADDGVRRRHGVDDDALLLLCLGRYSPEKAQDLLIRALADAAGDLPPVHLLLVGWGALESDLRETARSLGLADRVTVTGRVPTVAEYYAAADAFVLPSTTEGLSVTLLEAMAAGLPIVATDVAGTAEAVVDGETGLVVEPESRAALADALCRLGGADLERLGRRGHDRARSTFDIERTVAAYRALYRTATGREPTVEQVEPAD
ncbi:glycosyltransferase [Haloarcula litorea]|uniref:glycosyltransferase n=1 Tax=Haloarcula litorea TaxID=3032579 RepID=UPI0023E756B4|nr:glycosyltransferase [Halomicroarcula sp. GDY20]